jgi:hypothetical protein
MERNNSAVACTNEFRAAVEPGAIDPESVDPVFIEPAAIGPGAADGACNDEAGDRRATSGTGGAAEGVRTLTGGGAGR